ncbi:MAG: choice-of-anchor Q domain-containing protein [Thermoguttaceae bacterium]
MTETLEERQLLAVGAVAFNAVADTANVIDLTSSELTVDSLKEAIAAAAATTEDDVIRVPSGALDFVSAADEIVINVDSSTSGSITILAVGDGLTINANSFSRAFSVRNGDVTLQNLRCVNGFADYGGAIANEGDLTLVNTTLQSNVATMAGGAIANKGALVVCDSLITSNTSIDAGSAIYEGDFSCSSGVPVWISIPDQTGSKGTTISVDLSQYINSGDWTYSYSIADTTSVILASAPTLSASGLFSFELIGDNDFYGEDDYSAIDVTVTATNGQLSDSATFSVSLAEQTSVTLAAVLSNSTYEETRDEYAQSYNGTILGYANDEGIPSPSIVDVSDSMTVQVWLQDFDLTSYKGKIWDAGEYFIMGIEYRLHLENATVSTFTGDTDLARSAYRYRQLENGDYEFLIAYFSDPFFGYEEALLLDSLPIKAIDSSKPVSATIYQLATDFTFPTYTRFYSEATPRDFARNHINVDPSQTLFVSAISNSTEPLSSLPGVPFERDSFPWTYVDPNDYPYLSQGSLDSNALFSNALADVVPTMSLHNVTIANNVSWSKNGAVFLDGASTANLYNTIVAANTGSDFTNNDGGTLNAYNVLSSFTEWSNNEAVSFSYDPTQPLFTNAANGDFTLARDSQAIDVGANEYVQSALDLKGEARIQNGTVDLGAYEYVEITVAPVTIASYDSSTRQAIIKWASIEDAATYTLKLSRDDGATWADYKKGFSNNYTGVNGIYAGRSYSFRIYGVNSAGVTLPDYVQGTFAPITIDSTTTEYAVNSPITVNMTAADNASASIKWYYVTDSGDLEIAEAGNSLSYTPTDAPFDIKVVATGTGDSEGSSAELIFKKPQQASSTITVSTWNPDTRQAIIKWDAIEGAATYTLKFSRDGGTTWADYKKGFSNNYTGVNGIYAGRSYSFRVYGVNSAGETLPGYVQRAFAPITIDSTTTEYAVNSPITVNMTAADNASASIKWYYVTDSGDLEIAGADNSLSYTPTNAPYDIKVVVTGTGDSEGSSAELIFKKPQQDAPTITVSTWNPDARQAIIKWDAIEGATTYTLRFSKDGGTTWADYKKGFSNNYTGVNGIYAGRSYAFRIYGVDSSGVTLPSYVQGAFAPITIESSTLEYAVNSPITVTMTAADNASADIKWYYVTDSGDLEIAEAGNSLSYIPTDAPYDIKVVVTGTGDSVGSSAELIFRKPQQASSTITVSTWNSDARQAIIKWDAIEGAATYTLRFSKDGGTTWADYKKGFSNNYTGVNGIYAGRSYSFRVYGVDSSGVTLPGYAQGTFAPITIASTTTEYAVNSPITVNMTAADNASASIKWYYVTDSGDVEITGADNSLSYTPTDAPYDIKVVATGIGNSKGSSAELIFTKPDDSDDPVGEPLVVSSYDPSTRQAVLSWNPVANAATYRVMTSRDNGTTWATYRKDLTATTVQVNGLYVGRTYGFRVYGVTDTGANAADCYEITFTPTESSGALLDEAFADYFDELL